MEKEWVHMNKLYYLNYKTIYDILPNKRVKKRGFKCKICSKEFKVFSSAHLRTHGITKEEYIKKYGFPHEEYEKNYIFRQILKKFEDLYFMRRDKKLILSSKTANYSTIHAKEYKDHKGKTRYKNKLSTFDLIKHLEGKATLGVFSYKQFSKILVFDIDSYECLVDAQKVAVEIRNFLAKYFPLDQIHIIFSGGKGYHITLYFNETVSIKLLGRIFSIVLNEINIENYSNVNVEMRPELAGYDGRGVKLPCGVNFRYPDPHISNSNYSCFVDSKFKPIENEIEYILNIKQSSKNVLDKIIEDYKTEFITDYATKNPKTTNKNNSTIKNYESQKNTSKENRILEGNNYKQIIYWINNGLEQHGTRHNISFKIALFYKSLGYTADEAYEKLLKWSTDQIKTGYTKSSEKEIERDVRHIIYGSVFNSKKNYYLSWYRPNIKFTESELYPFIELNNISKKTGKIWKVEKKYYLLLWYMLSIIKILIIFFI